MSKTNKQGSSTVQLKVKKPAATLGGLELEGGWKVGNVVSNTPDDTGGNFSICYEVSNRDGQLAFLKALDLNAATSTENPVSELHNLTDSFLNEKNLLQICRSMSRVVTALHFGEVKVENSVWGEFQVVPYIIFELAENSVRSMICNYERPPFKWIVRCLHQAAVGMNQLHSKQISHQDFKPSNALIFQNEGLKLADLGRSVGQSQNVLHESEDWPGDWSYAPPELAYGYVDTEFNVRRLSSDIYLLGSFAVSMLTGVQLTAWIVRELPKDLRPPIWNGYYTGDYAEVIAHVEQAFAVVIEKIESNIEFQEQSIVKDLINSIRELCQPDPTKRGHPRTHAVQGSTGNPFSLERYISQFNLLENKARIYDLKMQKNL